MNPSSDFFLPGYLPVKTLYRTGLSTVYLADDLLHDREVVLKILEFDPDDVDHVRRIKRFSQEFILLKHLQHPNIATIYHRHTEENFICIVMEYFSGGDLSKKIRNREINHPQVVSYLRQIALGLQAVHEHGIIHRDLKPKNILFREDGSLAISDFGIAKVAGNSFGLTLKDTVLGTPYYMSPEQINNMKIDHRSDFYALGIILHEMLRGAKPFKGDCLTKILDAHITEPVPVLPSSMRDFQPILDRLLAKDPKNRFSRVSDLLYCLPEPEVTTESSDGESHAEDEDLLVT